MRLPHRERRLVEALRLAQDLFGRIEADYANDRAPDRADRVHRLTKEGFRLCLDALSPYPPQRLTTLAKPSEGTL